MGSLKCLNALKSLICMYFSYNSSAWIDYDLQGYLSTRWVGLGTAQEKGQHYASSNHSHTVGHYLHF